MKRFITIFGIGLFMRGFARLVPMPLQALGGWRRFITPPANFLVAVNPSPVGDKL